MSENEDSGNHPVVRGDDPIRRYISDAATLLYRLADRQAQHQEAIADRQLEAHKAGLENEREFVKGHQSQQVLKLKLRALLSVLGLVGLMAVTLLLIWRGHVSEAIMVIVGTGAFGVGWVGGKARGKYLAGAAADAEDDEDDD